MKLLDLVTTRSKFNRDRLLLAALVSSLGGMGVLVLVNSAAREIAADGVDKVDWLLAGMFALCIVAYAVAQFRLIADVGAAVDEAVDSMRMGLLDRVRRADYRRLERFGRSRLYESITQSTQTISQNATFLAIAFQSAVLVVVLALYLAYESWIAFTLVALMVAVAGRRYHLLGKKMGVRFQEMMAAENRQFESVTDLLDGFKEAKLWRERSQAIGDIYDELSDEGTESRIDTQNGAYQQFVFGQTAFYAMLALMVFVVPLYSDNFDGEITQATMAVLFLIGPIGVVIQSLTTLAGAEAAAAGMYRLDKILAGMEEETNGVDPFPAPFREVRMDQIRFTYGSLAGLDGADVNGIGPAPGARSDPAESAGDPEAPPELEAEPEPEPEPEEKPFAVGPINLTLRAGELVFLTGGNGSGKTTLIRLLTGLYRPDGGEIRVNGEPVSDMRRPDFRELTASVFSDVHLFPRLYGLSESGQERVRSLLPLFEMDAKVSFDGDRFSTIDLSQGQKKRLALIATLAEEKPILVLDEWAADQDPRFRKIFYRKILPALKEIGLCVIAVTHDDHYFDGADRRLHMDMGALEELPVPTKPGPPSILNGASSKSEAADKDGSAKPEEAH